MKKSYAPQTACKLFRQELANELSALHPVITVPWSENEILHHESNTVPSQMQKNSAVTHLTMVTVLSVMGLLGAMSSSVMVARLEKMV